MISTQTPPMTPPSVANVKSGEHLHAGIVCPSCGNLCAVASTQPNVESENATIAELEAQLRILTEKASAAYVQLAEYEDELRRVKAQQRKPSVVSLSETRAATPVSRFSALITRRSSPNVNANQHQHNDSQTLAVQSTAGRDSPVSRPQTPSLREHELQAQLMREQGLRQQVEVQLTQMSTEMEELSTSLFSQANDMVATERRARAKLEERVEVLERRDAEKKKRVERLEGAVRRIERVKTLLAPP